MRRWFSWQGPCMASAQALVNQLRQQHWQSFCMHTHKHTNDEIKQCFYGLQVFFGRVHGQPLLILTQLCQVRHAHANYVDIVLRSLLLSQDILHTAVVSLTEQLEHAVHPRCLHRVIMQIVQSTFFYQDIIIRRDR